MEIEHIGELDHVPGDEGMALECTGLEELGDGKVNTDYRWEIALAVDFVTWDAADRIVGLHTAKSANCTVAMLDMDSHMEAAADTAAKVMVAVVMFAMSQSQETSLEQGMPFVVEAVALCWRLVATHSTIGARLQTVEITVVAFAYTAEENSATVAGLTQASPAVVLVMIAILEPGDVELLL